MEVLAQFQQAKIGCPVLGMSNSLQCFLIDFFHACKSVFVLPFLGLLFEVSSMAGFKKAQETYHQSTFTYAMHDILYRRYVCVALEKYFPIHRSLAANT